MTVAHPMTADELMSLPDTGTRYELSQGKLICMSPSSYRPGRIAGKALARISLFVEQHKLGDYGSADSGFRLSTNPDTVRAPDAWFVRAARVPVDEGAITFYPGPPDLAVEVLSPTDRFTEVARKVREYLDAGTPLVWVIDPEARSAAVFRPGERVRFLDENGALDGEDLLPGFLLPLGELFK